MRIVIIGAGNVATHLAKALDNKHDIIQVYSKELANAQTLAKLLKNASYTDTLSHISQDADLYIISVKDDAIKDIVSEIKFDSGIWVHTSGSVAIDIFATSFSNYGVLYPLQTFSKDVEVNISEIPFFIEGNKKANTTKIEDVARALSNQVLYADSSQRKSLHIAAVFGCNFVNHLWTQADEILHDAGYEFDILVPLIKATLNKAALISPIEGQTGPARRGDKNIMQSHEQMLPPSKAKLYNILSQSIINKYNNRNE